MATPNSVLKNKPKVITFKNLSDQSDTNSILTESLGSVANLSNRSKNKKQISVASKPAVRPQLSKKFPESILSGEKDGPVDLGSSAEIEKMWQDHSKRITRQKSII